PLEGFQVCRKDTKIDPDGQDGANLPCKFCVRYKPADTPDTNYVVIKSNDPDNESKRVKVEGQTDPGDLQVTKPDPTCLDFTAVEEVGATCTKIVKLYNNGTGGVTVDRPKLRPTTQKSYSVDWYKVDAATTTGACTYTPAPNALIPASQTQFRLDPGDSVDVAVTYNSPGGNGESGTLVIEYHQPFAGTAEVQLCGGAEKCNLELSPPTGTQLVFHGNVPDVKKKTLVLMNKGNGACTVNYVRVPDDLQACDVEGSFVVNPPVNGTAVPAFGLVPVTVEFRTDLDEKFVISNCQVEVSYVDSLTGTEQFPRINMTGHRGDFEGVDLPVAVPEALPLVEGEPFVKGVPFTLDGSGSTTGTHPIFEDGYRWFVTAKPAGSQVFLNEQAGPAQTTVTPDATGQYEFRLVVFSVSDDGKGFFFSDEGVLKLTVVQ
ncbi:MAG: hypothetical protein FJ087_21410, partial [Deltaproteobacteria bacterium]|nr:hypothetical protein [Deltaproteobacteria bacterium]